MDNEVKEKNAAGFLAAFLWLGLSIFAILSGWYLAAIIIIAVFSTIGLLGPRCKLPDSVQLNLFFGGIILALFVFLLVREELSFNSFMTAVFVPGLLSLPLALSDPACREKLNHVRLTCFDRPHFSYNTPEAFGQGCLIWVLTMLVMAVLFLLFGIYLVAFLYFVAIVISYSNISWEQNMSGTAGKARSIFVWCGKKFQNFKTSADSRKNNDPSSNGKDDNWL